MSDQGFHEVQLSGKQLVFLFMSAVVLAVVIFLLGVNVGRGVRTAVGDTGVSAQAEQPPTVVPDDPTPGAAGAKPAQPELSYHDMLLGASAAGDQKPAADPPVPVSETPPTPTPVPTQMPALPPTAMTESVASPVPSPAPTRAVAPPTAPKSRPSDWFLQVGAYSTQAVADGQVAKLKQLNVPAFVDVGATSKLFRVRIGPYADRAEAEQIKGRIARQGFSSSITR